MTRQPYIGPITASTLPAEHARSTPPVARVLPNQRPGAVLVCAHYLAKRSPDVPGTVRCHACGTADHGMLVRRLDAVPDAAAHCPDCSPGTALHDSGAPPGLLECRRCDSLFVTA